MKGNRSVDDIIKRVAKRLGRGPDDVEPIIDSLRQNWYDSAKDLSSVSQEDLLAIGIPLRIAKELLAEVGGGAGGGGWVDYEIPRRKGAEKGKEKGRDKGKEKGKEKGKGKGGYDGGIIRAASPNKGKGKGKKEIDEGVMRTHDIPIETEKYPEDFPWKARILGERRRNAEHIQKETGVKVYLQADGIMVLSVSATEAVTDENFDRAVEMCTDLLEHIYGEASGWAGADGEPAKTGKGKGKSGGKSKGSSVNGGKGSDKGSKTRGRQFNDKEGPEFKRRR